MLTYRIPRPVAGDIVDLVLADHRLMEDLLREVRRSDSDRAAARTALAELLIAHGEAEEESAYPKMQRRRAIGAHEVEHGEEEHAELNEALLALLECKGTDTQKFDNAVEELGKTVTHHLAEEELTILNPAREELSAATRGEIGFAWATRRNEYLDQGCASADQVAAIVARAHKEGLLTAEDDEEE